MEQKRIKSIIMWLGFISTALLAVGIDWQDLTSWQSLWVALLEFIKNPSSLILFGITLYSVANNPTNKNGF